MKRSNLPEFGPSKSAAPIATFSDFAAKTFQTGRRLIIGFLALASLQLYSACVSTGVVDQPEPSFVASTPTYNPYANGYSRATYTNRGYRRPNWNSSSQSYSSPYHSPFDSGYANQNMNLAYNQNPTNAFLDQNGTSITPLRDYLRDNMIRPDASQTSTLYRPTAGYDHQSQTVEDWPSYNPTAQ